MRTFEKSHDHLRRAHAVTPGASQTGSKAPGRAGPIDAYPLFLARGHGAEVEDVDGHVYIDLIASLAAVGLGHAHPQVIEAVYQRLRTGHLLSLPLPLETEASDALLTALQWPEQVRWVKTGSEATEAAVRIARCATGREKVLTVGSGYHSWHAWFQAVKPVHPGVPAAYESLVAGLPYGNRQDWGFALSVSNAAAVILEPAPITGDGDAEFLRWLVETAHQWGTLVIFDEVVWGCRLALAGGTEYFHVQPDLACYGKALGNGIPVGAVVGSSHLMQYASVVSGTFGGDGMGLAAAVAVLQTYYLDHSLERMWDHGTMLQRLLNMAFPASAGTYASLRCSGYPVHPILHVQAEGTPDDVAMSYFLQQMAQRGVLLHPAGCNIMAALTQAHVLEIVHAASEVMAMLSAIRRNGHPVNLIGDPFQAAFSRAR